MARFNNPAPQYIDTDGTPLSGGKLNFYITETSTRKDTYSDEALTTPNDNPVTLNNSGTVPNIFLAEDVAYKLQILRADGSLFDEIDPVSAVPSEGQLGAWSSTTTYNIPDVVVGSDDCYYKSIVDSNLNNDPVSSPEEWTKVAFLSYWNTNETYAADDIVIGSDGQLYSAQESTSAIDPTTNGTVWAPAIEQASSTDYSYNNFRGFN